MNHTAGGARGAVIRIAALTAGLSVHAVAMSRHWRSGVVQHASSAGCIANRELLKPVMDSSDCAECEWWPEGR